jgi:PQQ-like domain
MRQRSAIARQFPLVLTLLAMALGGAAFAKDDIKLVPPAPPTVTAPDLGALGATVSVLARNDRLYVGTTAGLAVVGADGKVLSSVPLPAMSARGLDADGDQVAYTSYVIGGVVKDEGVTGALMWGAASDKMVVSSAEVGLVGADGKVLWSTQVAEPSAMSPPALGKDAIAVQGAQTLNLYNRADGAAAPPVTMYKNWLGISKNWVSRMPVTRPLWIGDEVFAGHQSYLKRVSAKGAELDYTIELGKNFTVLLSGPVLCKDKIMVSEAAYPEGNIFTGKKARVYAGNAMLKPIWYAATEEEDDGVGDLACDDDRIYAVSNTRVAAFTHEGKEAWQYESSDRALMWATHRGILKAGSLAVANQIYAGRQVVAAGPYLYVVSRSGKDFRDKRVDEITVFDAKTGKRVEKLEVNAMIVDMTVFGPNLALATSSGLRFIGLKQ